MQHPENLVHNLHDSVKSFESKLDLWQIQLKNYDFTHFEKLLLCEGYDMNKYVAAIAEFKGEFKCSFIDFRQNEKMIDLLAWPFSVPVENVPGNMQMEIIDLLKERFNLGLSEL